MAGSWLAARIFSFYLLIIHHVRFGECSSDCSQAIDKPCSDPGTCSTNQTFHNEGIQLLIPSMNFSCEGTITQWVAHIASGNVALHDQIELQIYEPDTSSNGDTYRLVYGNSPSGSASQTGSKITWSVGFFDNIPITTGYIIGVYLPSSTVLDSIGLMYETITDGGTAAGGHDVYVWTGVSNRTCQYSLCTAENVLKNVNLLIGWTFLDTPITSIETNLASKKASKPNYCQFVDSVQGDCPIVDTHQSSSVTLITSSSVQSVTNLNNQPSTSTSSSITPSSSTSNTNILISSTSSTNHVTVSTTPSTAHHSTSTPIVLADNTTAVTLQSAIPTDGSNPSLYLSTNAVIPSTTSTGYNQYMASSSYMPPVIPSASALPNDDATPSTVIGGLSNFSLALLGIVFMLLILIVTLVIILVLLVTSKRRKKNYQIEGYKLQDNKMELEAIHIPSTDHMTSIGIASPYNNTTPTTNILHTSANPSYQIMSVIDHNGTADDRDTKEPSTIGSTGYHPTNATGLGVPYNHDKHRSVSPPPITNASVKQQQLMDEDYTEIDDLPESSRKDYVKMKVVEDYCEPNVVFTSSLYCTPLHGTITQSPQQVIYETMDDADYDIPRSNNDDQYRRQQHTSNHLHHKDNKSRKHHH